uniref:TIR domain-containing protein n=1 Tax=Pelusios castaneus TaxID=367368 RepID=A0A8C8S713_9SAUR
TTPCHSGVSRMLWQVLLLIDMFLGAGTIFPNFPPCANSTDGKRVDCSLCNLSLLPNIHSFNVSFLNLGDNFLSLLANDSFSGIPNLRNLSVSWNCKPKQLRKMHKDCQLLIQPGALVTLNFLANLSLAGNSLTRVPPLPSSLCFLDLSYNNILSLGFQDLAELSNMRELHLGYNCYYQNPCSSNVTLAGDAFKAMTSLTQLSLKFNNMSVVPQGLPQTLLQLDLSENKIPHVNNLENLTKLEVLNLEWNCQRCDHAAQPCFPCPNNDSLAFDTDAFQNLRKLRSLNLRGNSLKDLNTSIFSSLGCLETLDLSDNFLTWAIRNGTFFSALKSVQTLNLGYNYHFLVTFENLTLSASFSHMKALKTLIINGYFFRNVAEDGIKALFNLSNLEVLIFKTNFIRDVNLSLFSRCRRLNFLSLNIFPAGIYCNKILDLSFNSIQSINPAQFKELDSIDCLNLSANYISQALNGSQFLTLPFLRLLDLSHNRFDLYYSSALQEVRHLVVLDLSNNQFHFTIKGLGHKFEFLTNLTSLAFLNLDNNQIGIRISKHLESSSLKTLIFIGGNRYLEFFAKLPSLMHLDISFNNLDTIPGKVIDTLPKSLINLSIASNNLFDFPWNRMGNLSSLEILDLSNNALETLITGFHSKNLMTLNLSYNKIKVLHEKFFSNFSSLHFLSLDHNMIKLIDDTSFPHTLFKSLQNLDVSNNPLKCTCEPLLSMDLRSCQDIYGHQSFLCTSLIVTFVTVLPVLYKLYGWDFWYLSHIFQAAVRRGYAQRSTPSCDEYDAFIAFDSQHSAVADWVYNEMVTQLEENGRRRYKLCLEERDWTAGRSRIENLCDSIYKSRKTIFILTRDGFGSGFLRHTFFITQQRLLNEKVDVIILVLLDTNMKMSKFLLTRKRLCGRTVLDWPCNPFAQSYFWHCMRALLAHDISHFYDSHLWRSIDSSGTREFATS